MATGRISTDMTHRAVPQRQLSFLYLEWLHQKSKKKYIEKFAVFSVPPTEVKDDVSVYGSNWHCDDVIITKDNGYHLYTDDLLWQNF